MHQVPCILHTICVVWCFYGLVSCGYIDILKGYLKQSTCFLELEIDVVKFESGDGTRVVIWQFVMWYSMIFMLDTITYHIEPLLIIIVHSWIFPLNNLKTTRENEKWGTFQFQMWCVLHASLSCCRGTSGSCRPQMGPCWPHEPCYEAPYPYQPWESRSPEIKR